MRQFHSLQHFSVFMCISLSGIDGIWICVPLFYCFATDVWNAQETLNCCFAGFCSRKCFADSSGPGSFTSLTEFTATRWWRTKISASLTNHSETRWKSSAGRETFTAVERERSDANQSKTLSVRQIGKKKKIFTVFLHSLPPPEVHEWRREMALLIIWHTHACTTTNTQFMLVLEKEMNCRWLWILRVAVIRLDSSSFPRQQRWVLVMHLLIFHRVLRLILFPPGYGGDQGDEYILPLRHRHWWTQIHGGAILGEPEQNPAGSAWQLQQSQCGSEPCSLQGCHVSYVGEPESATADGCTAWHDFRFHSSSLDCYRLCSSHQKEWVDGEDLSEVMHL